MALRYKLSNDFSRRTLFSNIGMGLAGIVAAELMASSGIARASQQNLYLPSAKAKRVIWIFLVGGMSHMESFDPKPALNDHAGKTIAESPYAATLDSPFLKKNLREFVEGLHKVQPKLYPLQVGFKKYGQSGLEISDWWSNLGTHCADDLAIVRSMWTTDNDHGAQLQFHTGRHALEGRYPTIGSWVHYGLGIETQDLPAYCVLGTHWPTAVVVSEGMELIILVQFTQGFRCLQIRLLRSHMQRYQRDTAKTIKQLNSSC